MPKAPPPPKRIVVYCTEEEHRQFKAMGAAMGLSHSELLLLLMDHYKKTKPKEG